jgi:hypothetical protein
MKEIKFYNVLFPIWLILFFPPVIFITLFGNFIIDSLVVFAAFKIYRMTAHQIEFGSYYKKSVIKVWLFGFAADLIGAVILFLTGIAGDPLNLPYEVTAAINYDPFSHPAGLAVVIFAMLISGLFIFIFNYFFTFARLIEDIKLRFKTAMTIAVATIPWTFLLPTKWFYYSRF